MSAWQWWLPLLKDCWAVHRQFRQRSLAAQLASLPPLAATPQLNREQVLWLRAWLLRFARVLKLACLARSMAFLRVLRRAGIAAELRIGAEPKDIATRSSEQRPLAHAWLDWNGAAIGEDADHLARLQPLHLPNL
jgi:hypothetical protein